MADARHEQTLAHLRLLAGLPWATSPWSARTSPVRRWAKGCGKTNAPAPTPSIAERKAALLAQLAEIEAAEQEQARAAAQAQQQRAVIAAVATFQLGVRQRALREALAVVDAQLEGARGCLPTKPARSGATAARASANGANGRDQNPALLFFVAFKKVYPKTGLAQSVVSAACRAAGIDQKDQSPENVARAYAQLQRQGTIS